LGPQLERIAECENFLSKYTDDKAVLSGPYIEGGRWVVEIPRKHPDAAALFRERLADGGKNAGVAELVSKAILSDLKVLANGDILKVYTENSDFAVFLSEFVLSKPFWLK
jgi:hypothetical protein